MDFSQIFLKRTELSRVQCCINILLRPILITMTLQCGQRYYASTFFRDFQNVFHDIIPGLVWKVSSVISCSCSKSEYFLIKIARLRRKKRKSGWPTVLCKCVFRWNKVKFWRINEQFSVLLVVVSLAQPRRTSGRLIYILNVSLCIEFRARPVSHVYDDKFLFLKSVQGELRTHLMFN